MATASAQGLQEKQFSSGLMDLLKAFGEKTSTTTQGTANTAPLQQVFSQAQQPMSMELYNAMIGDIFNQAAMQIPELTTALANATGSRTSGNSALALGLDQQRSRAANAAASNVLNYNTQQQQIAGQAAGNIANATRGQTQQQTQQTAVNPLVGLAGGFLLNQADKRGWLDKAGNAVADIFGGGSGGTDFQTVLGNVGSEWNMAPTTSFMPSGDSFSGFSAGDSGMGGFDTGSFFDFSGLGSGLSDIGSGIGDFIGGIGDSIGSFFNWADGGRLGRSFPATGGWNDEFMAQCLVPSYPSRMMPGAVRGVGGYADGGRVSSYIGNAPRLPMQRPTMFADGGRPGVGMPRQVAGPGYRYADGGITRNRNYLGGPLERSGMMAFDPSMMGGAPAAMDSIGSNMGINSGMLQEMLLRELQSLDAGGEMTGDNGFWGSPAGALSQAMGNPGNAAVASGLLGYLGNIGVSGLMQGDPMGAFALSQGAKGLGMPGGGLMSLLGSMAQAGAAQQGAMESINNAPDPMGAFLGALNAAKGGTLGDMGGLSTADAVAAANAISGMSMGAISAMDALMSVTGAFGTAAGGDVGVGGDGLGFAGMGDAGTGGSSGEAGFGGAATGGSDFGGGWGDASFGGGWGDAAGFGGDAGFGGGDSGGGDSGGGDGGGGGDGYSDGGKIRGKGTGTSDSIPAKNRIPGGNNARFSDGEFIFPADSVRVLGEDFLNRLLQATHTPVNR